MFEELYYLLLIVIAAIVLVILRDKFPKIEQENIGCMFIIVLIVVALLMGIIYNLIW